MYVCLDSKATLRASVKWVWTLPATAEPSRTVTLATRRLASREIIDGSATESSQSCLLFSKIEPRASWCSGTIFWSSAEIVTQLGTGNRRYKSFRIYCRLPVQRWATISAEFQKDIIRTGKNKLESVLFAIKCYCLSIQMASPEPQFGHVSAILDGRDDNSAKTRPRNRRWFSGRQIV